MIGIEVEDGMLLTSAQGLALAGAYAVVVLVLLLALLYLYCERRKLHALQQTLTEQQHEEN